MKAQFAALTLCAVLLAGCGASPSASPTTPAPQTNDYLAPPNATNQSASVPEPSGPGTYLVGIKDATVLLQVPSTQQPDSETLAVLKLIGVTPGSWISADIDNRKGQESAVLTSSRSPLLQGNVSSTSPCPSYPRPPRPLVLIRPHITAG